MFFMEYTNYILKISKLRENFISVDVFIHSNFTKDLLEKNS